MSGLRRRAGMRALDARAPLDDDDGLAHEICRQMHGREACVCSQAKARPCQAIERLTKTLVCHVEDHLREQRRRKRAERRGAAQ